MKKNSEKEIPIVFTFDDNYVLPAWIAIKSLVRTKNKNTQYKIYCIYQNLCENSRKKLDKLANINWIKFSSATFDWVPYSWEYPITVYFRLILHEMLSQYDKIIYSDVDVLFQWDLSKIYGTNLDGKYWAGVPLEKNVVHSEEFLSKQKWRPTDPFYLSWHTKFEENTNKYIFASWFMLINAKKMREDKMTQKFIWLIKKYKDKLKMFDLEILNLACQNNTIKKIPFKYCVLEDVSNIKKYRESNTYLFLSQIYSKKELHNSVLYPKILHYTWANSVRIRDRLPQDQQKRYNKYYNMVKKFI